MHQNSEPSHWDFVSHILTIVADKLRAEPLESLQRTSIGKLLGSSVVFTVKLVATLFVPGAVPLVLGMIVNLRVNNKHAEPCNLWRFLALKRSRN